MRRREFLAAGLLLPALPAQAAKETFSRGLLWRVTFKGVLALLEQDGFRAARLY